MTLSNRHEVSRETRSGRSYAYVLPGMRWQRVTYGLVMSFGTRTRMRSVSRSLCSSTARRGQLRPVGLDVADAGLVTLPVGRLAERLGTAAD